MSERSADPTRTFALVVGIEKYDAGSNWNLDGPVTDALEFYQWLLARNVSRENIHLLLSPLDENIARIQESNLGASPATSSAIRYGLNALHETKGDLLMLFWAGHGIVSGEKQRRLFYADATGDDKRNLDLDSLLKSFGSSYFGGFPRQILFIDACANYAEECIRSNCRARNCPQARRWRMNSSYSWPRRTARSRRIWARKKEGSFRKTCCRSCLATLLCRGRLT